MITNGVLLENQLEGKSIEIKQIKTDMAKKEIGLPDEIVMNQIYLVRGQKVMLNRFSNTL